MKNHLIISWLLLFVPDLPDSLAEVYHKIVDGSDWDAVQRRHIASAIRELAEACKLGKQLSPQHMAVLVHVLPRNLSEAFKLVLAVRNGRVVDFNQHLTAVRGCNTAIYLLHNGVSARTVVFYLIDYMTKNPSERACTAAIAIDAKLHIDSYPSVAADSGTEQRTARHHLNRIMNELAAKDAGEYPLALAANAILGAPPEQLSHNVVTINLRASFELIRQHMTPEQLQPDFGEHDGADQADSDLFQMFLRPTDAAFASPSTASASSSESPSASAASIASTSSESCAPSSSTSQATGYFDPFDEEMGVNIDGDEDEEKRAVAEAFANFFESVAEETSSSRSAGIARRSGASEGVVQPEVGDDGNLVLIDFAVAYFYRGLTFKAWSEFEFKCGVQVVKHNSKKKSSSSPSSASTSSVSAEADEAVAEISGSTSADDEPDEEAVDSQSSSNSASARRTAGRPASPIFLFHPDCPYYQSHGIRIRSKFVVCKIYPPPRPAPPHGPGVNYKSAPWRQRASDFARQALLLHRPLQLSPVDGRPEPQPLTWKAFVDYVRLLLAVCNDDKQAQATLGIGPLVAWVRFTWIHELCFSLTPSDQMRSISGEFRSRAATRWLNPLDQAAEAREKLLYRGLRGARPAGTGRSDDDDHEDFLAQTISEQARQRELAREASMAIAELYAQHEARTTLREQAMLQKVGFYQMAFSQMVKMLYAEFDREAEQVCFDSRQLIKLFALTHFGFSSVNTLTHAFCGEPTSMIDSYWHFCF